MSQAIQGPYRPEDFPPVDVAAVEEFESELAKLKSHTYTGHDPEHLVAAVVDGEGTVHDIRFANSASTRSREVIEQAVVAAVAVAHQRMDEEREALVAREYPELAAPTTSGNYGGIEMAFDPQDGDVRD